METMNIVLDLIYLFTAVLISFALYPLWINFVYKFQMGEEIRPDGPATHLKKSGTPTMGGLIFVLTVAVVTYLFNRSRTQTLFPVFVASMAALLGLFEDFTKVYRKSGLPGFFEYHISRLFKSKKVNTKKYFFLKPWYKFQEMVGVLGSTSESGLQSYQKLIIQLLIAGFVAYWTYFKLGWDFLWFPLIGDVHIGFLYPAFVFIFFFSFMNAVAFTDGLDGLAGGLSLISFIAFWVIASVLQYNSLAAFCATFIGALLPFMYFNVFPARVFMGDVGSHVLGAVLPLLAILLHREVAFMIIGLVFLFDGFSSPIQQLSVKFTGKRLFRMAPVHHHFELLGWHESKVTLRFYLAGILAALVGLFIALL